MRVIPIPSLKKGRGKIIDVASPLGFQGDIVIFLASRASDGVHGQVIVVDGGRMARQSILLVVD